MFAIRSWTEVGHAQPYRAVCDSCREDVMEDTELERWRWIQHHLCPRQASVLYLSPRRDARPQA